MELPRFYYDQTLDLDSCVVLSGQAFRHAIQVLRLQTGAGVTLFNGCGGEYRGTITALGRREATVAIDSYCARNVESPLSLMLAQVISKGERMDYTLQKAVELGVTAIAPLRSQRSVVRLDAGRLARRQRHWRGVVVSACEQSGRNIVPVVKDSQDLISWLGAVDSASLKVVLDPGANNGLQSLSLAGGQPVIILVGPEGGLTSAELDTAHDAGFYRIKLGARTLRTETAGMAALAAIQTLWGDFS